MSNNNTFRPSRFVSQVLENAARDLKCFTGSSDSTKSNHSHKSHSKTKDQMNTNSNNNVTNSAIGYPSVKNPMIPNNNNNNSTALIANNRFSLVLQQALGKLNKAEESHENKKVEEKVEQAVHKLTDSLDAKNLSVQAMTLIHCFANGQTGSLKKFAASAGFQSTQWSESAVALHKNSNLSDGDALSFLNLFRNNSDFAILDEAFNVTEAYIAQKSTNSNSKCLFGSHFKRKANNSLISTLSTHSSSASYGYTATYFGQRYNVPTTVPPGTKPVIAIVSLGGGYQLTDLHQYWSTVCGLSTYPTVVNVAVGQSEVGRYTGSDSDLENTLDLEISGAICPSSTLIFVSAPNTLTGFYEAFVAACSGSITIGSTTYKPSIVTCSWGSPEVYFTSATMNAFNSVFSTAASKGITVCVAAGDSGSSDGYNNGKPNVDFPSSSPWVVSCGGSSITSSATVDTVWSYNKEYQWGTGGGFSSTFSMPSWQNHIVTVPSNATPSATNLTGKRGVPDLAANADPLNGWTITFGGQNYINEVGGTSCVAPFMAGLLGQLNFTYPVSFCSSLYQIYTNTTDKSLCFHDVTSGSNDDITRSTNEWNASTNWDPCTGLGTLNGSNLQSVLARAGLLTK